MDTLHIQKKDIQKMDILGNAHYENTDAKNTVKFNFIQSVGL